MPEDQQTTPANGTPPAVAPAAGAAPAAPAPAARAAAPAPAKPNKNGQRRDPTEEAFVARASRMAASLIKKRFGMTIEEAEALIKKGGGVQPAATPEASAAAAASAAGSNHDREMERLRKQNTKLIAQNQQVQQRSAKAITRANDKRIEAEIRFAARSAGMVDPDYGVILAARAAALGKLDDPDKFFTDLKGTHAHLFTAPAAAAAAAAPAGTPAPAAAAAPVTVPASTTPPESQQPGGERPAPAAGGGAPSPNVEQMDAPTFARYKRERYGVTQ